LLGLRTNGGYDAWVLMAEVAALGEAAHVEDAPAVLEMQPRAGTTDHRRRVPVRLRAPAVQDQVSL
jgi:hypothetical protein